MDYDLFKKQLRKTQVSESFPTQEMNFFLLIPACVLIPFWRHLEVILDDLSDHSFAKEQEDKPLFPPILFICNLAFKETKPPLIYQ